MFQSLQLKQFRNSKLLSSGLSFDDKTNIFIGSNGAGKTNLIEALCIIATSQSFRSCNADSLIELGKEQAKISARYRDANDHDFQIDLLIEKSKKQHTINEKKTTVQSLRDNFPIITFVPEDLNHIKSGDEKRRELVDQALLALGGTNPSVQFQFQRLLKSRNQILKDFKVGRRDITTTQHLLDAIAPLFVTAAARQTALRIDFLQKIRPLLYDALREVGLPDSAVEFSYRTSQEDLIHFTHEDIHSLIQKRIAELRGAELARGVTLVGPHRHQIEFKLGNLDSRFFASQGQSRALILSFKMAQIVYHREHQKRDAILLLDDVLSELDEQKRECLIEFLVKIPTQIFLTTTDLKMTGQLNNRRCRVFKVNQGMIEE